MKKETLDFTTPFELRYFVNTFSYREIVSAFAMALCATAVQDILEYYSDGSWIGGNGLDAVVAMALMLVNHAIYRIEHCRSNNFLGRNLHDLLFLIALGTVYMLIKLIEEGAYHPPLMLADAGSFILMFVFISFWIFLFEAGVALLKYFLRQFGWRPF